MKKSKLLTVLSFIIILVLVMTACSAKSETSKSDNGTAVAPNDSAAYDISYESYGEAPAASEEKPKSDGLTTTSGTSSNTATIPMQDKIIRTFFMDVETQEFDSLITQINSEINRLQGYVESSNISGKSYYSEGARNGSIVARIPSKKVDEFVKTVNDNANVVNSKEDTDNVSLEYIEAESRIDTLKIEQDRLFAILEKEVSLENIITLESRLSDIRYELQNYESQLRFYDNKVEFSTVTLNIQEVEKLTAVKEVKQTVGTRIKNGFSDTMYKITEGLKNFIVWFVVNLPYLLIWAVIILAIVLIVRRFIKKQKAKEANKSTPVMIHEQQEKDHTNNSGRD